MKAFFKKNIFVSILLTLAANISPKAQTFITDTIVYNGNSSKFINLVFMGDGFQSGELSNYITNVKNVSNYLLNTSPFLEYKNYFNVFAVRVPSQQSGATHPATASDESSSGGQPVLSVNTYFNSTFDYFSIHRLLVPQNGTAVNNVLINNFPFYDQPMVLVNTPYYGGSGGFLATTSLHTSAFEILVHELGHSFANLADEYFAGDFYSAEKANMTQQTNPALVKWKNWIGTNGIGIYQYCCGGNSASWYKPHQSCKMQYLGYPFCAVCKEAIVETIHNLIGNPILAMSPANPLPLRVCTEKKKFFISLIKPAPNTLKVSWLLNGTKIAANIDSVLIDASQLTNISNTLSVQVTDTTDLSRSDTHAQLHTYITNWTLSKDPAIRFLAADTTVFVVCGNEKSNLSNLYNTGGMSTVWDIPNPAVADTGTHVLIATNNEGCSDTAHIKVKQQVAIWVGNINSNWHNEQNWMPQLVPDEKTHVIIPGNTNFPCIISTHAAVAASIQLRAGGNYSVINNQTLDIKSNCSSLPVQ